VLENLRLTLNVFTTRDTLARRLWRTAARG
jgi:hypothetical protein